MSSAQDNAAEAESTVERYAAGQMEDWEEREFEAVMLERPDLVVGVSAAHRLHDGFSRLHEAGELDRALRIHPSKSRYYATAAAVVVLVMGGSALLFLPKFSGTVPSMVATSLSELHLRSSDAHEVLGTYILANARSQDRSTSVEIPRGRGAVALRILPATPSDSRRYQVTLERVDDRSAITTLGQFTATSGNDGSVSVYLNPSALDATDYRISIAQGSHVDRFGIHLVRAAQ